MKNPLGTHWICLCPTIPPAKMSGEERVKAVVLLQSLLVEAAFHAGGRTVDPEPEGGG
ncbi:hypothetical protein [Mesorhizobium sp. M1365]|uniref:hypothetical protein n=1 Tax=Mesorhizobium sp. M1365 TaxID=2957090 RepID=UPI003336D949